MHICKVRVATQEATCNTNKVCDILQMEKMKWS